MIFNKIKTIISSIVVLVICFQIISCSKSVDTSESKANTLLQKMTLEEKVGQMAQITLDVLGNEVQPGQAFRLDTNKLKDAIVNYNLGSVLNTSDNKAMSLNDWNEIINIIQKETGKTRLKVPVIYGFDAIHGATYVSDATFFPQQIGQAATWNPKLVYEAAVATAYESRAAAVPWNFAPVLDLGTNPLWPRLWETFGEDPYLVSVMGEQVIKGYQDSIGNSMKVAACIKHFLAYSDPKSGKDRTNSWMPEHYLREYHLPAFAAAVKAGARTVMVNSGLINGIPTHINSYLLTDVLKNELGFKGVIVTDWQDIENVIKRDKIASSNKDALMMAINAGIDMSMIPYNYHEFCKDLIELVNEKKVSMKRIDDAVRRILTLKYDLNLFETPVTDYKLYPKFGDKSFESLAYNTAAESIVLLKNKNDILPISSGKKILITGPNANSMRTLNGGWSYSWQGEKTDQFTSKYNTILAAVKNKFGTENVRFSEGVAYKMDGKYYEDSVVNIASVISVAAAVDYVLVCAGENSYTEKPGDLNDLTLSENQLQLIKAVIKTGKPVILILNEGRPRIISSIEADVAGIIQVFLPGNFGADALADIISGQINPSGKLPITYPKYVNALTNYIHKPSDSQSNPQGVYDYSADFNPQFPFGFGLSYSTFIYSNLKVNKTNLMANDELTVTVSVKNSGKYEGKEVVQLYVKDMTASLTPDVKRLRGFEKISLKPGEEKIVNIKLLVKQLAFINTDNKWHLEKGDFEIQVNELKKLVNVDKTIIF